MYAYLASTPMRLDDHGVPLDALAFVDLDASAGSQADLAAARDSALHAQRVLVGVASTAPHPSLDGLIDALTCTVASEPRDGSVAGVTVPDIDAACARIASMVGNAPRTALVLDRVLRVVSGMSALDGLVAESLAYSMLLAGPEFARWRMSVPRSAAREATSEPVIVQRRGDLLDIVLNRPERHNCFGHAMRDALVEALDIALLDGSLTVRLSGNGASFCSGGDLDEFGVAPDPVTAHLVRLEQSVAARLYRCRDRVEAHLHGACFGAGLEMPAFAASVAAAADTYFELPELGMGLIPGAGGTVSVTARIGRWRTAYLCLSRQRIDAPTALAWGLIDRVG